MRWFRRILLFVGMLLGLLLGALAHLVAGDLFEAAEVGRPAPRTITLAELSASGPGDNAHVEVTDFTFGEPVIEQEGDSWTGAWIPLEPADGAKPLPRPVVLRWGDALTQARLDDLLARRKVTALAAAPLSQFSIWQVQPSEALRRARPDLDLDKTVFLRYNPRVDLDTGLTVLGEERIFEPATARTSRAAGWALLGLAALAAVLLVRGFNWGPALARRCPPPPDEEQLRDRLLTEAPLSLHTFRFGGALARFLGMAFGAVFFLGCTFFNLTMTAHFLQRAEPVPAALAGFFTLGTFVGMFVLLGMAVRTFTRGALQVEVCPGGLRWYGLGVPRAALWSDIARFDRMIAVTRYGQRMDHAVIVFYWGESLVFWDYSLSDYETFADAVDSEFHQGALRTGTDRVGASLRRAFAEDQRREWTGR
jgi:hypothetical protein